MSIQGQCHFLTLIQDHLHKNIKTCFSQKPQGHFLSNVVCKEMKIYKYDAGHMIKMAAMPIPFKNILPWKQWNDFKETWYVASGTPVHHSLFKL